MPDAHLEPESELTPKERDMHRALISIVEELDAVDWYNERIAVVADEALKRVLIHNANEEKEHAAMLLEWVRRRDAAFDEKLRDYLFTSRDIVAEEASAEGRSSSSEAVPVGEGAAASTAPRWTVGSLKSKALSGS